MNTILAKARAALILDQPFFATLFLSMPLVIDTNEKTFATDGESIFYNPAYLEGLQLPHMIFVLAHETLHCVFEHMFTRGNRNANRWNIAADYVINEMLINEKIGIMPPGGLYNPSLVKQGKGVTELVYELLPAETEKNGPGKPGGAMDNCRDGGKDPADKAAKQAEMKLKVVQAKNAAKMAGNMPGSLEKMVNEMTKTDVPWRYILRRFLSERCKVDLSFSRPKRRFIAEDVYLPSLTGEKLGKIVIMTDCSGSAFTDNILKMFGGEINGIREDVRPSETQVIYFDTQVLKVDTFGPDDTFKLTPVGGGGTAFSPIFAHIETQDEKPVACIVLTDLICEDFGPVPSFPVLWASTQRRDKVPFGEIVYLKDEGSK